MHLRYLARLGRMMVLAAALSAISVHSAQLDTPIDREEQDKDYKLPSGKSQRDEILKAAHAKTLRELEQIQKLAQELKAALEKNDYHVLSISSLKKAEELEKLAHHVRSRIRQQ